MCLRILGNCFMKVKYVEQFSRFTQCMLQRNQRGILLFEKFLLFIQSDLWELIIIFLFVILSLLLFLIVIFIMLLGDVVVGRRRYGANLHFAECHLHLHNFTSMFQLQLAKTAAATVRSQIERMSERRKVISNCQGLKKSRSIISINKIMQKFLQIPNESLITTIHQYWISLRQIMKFPSFIFVNYLIEIYLILGLCIQRQAISIIFYYRRKMNSEFYSHRATPNEIIRCTINYMRNYNRNHTNNLDDAFERNKNDRYDNMSKNRYHRQEKIQNQAENQGKKTYASSSKPSKLYVQQNIMKKIDKILQKNALSHMQTPNFYPNMDNFIEQGTFFTNLHEKIQIQKADTPQNEQANQEKDLKSRKVRTKLQLSKIQANQTKNNTIALIDSYKNKQFRKENFEQYKQISSTATPSQNQWQNCMNLIRSQKKQSEKSKKYCRVMIRRINTDQLFIKRDQSHTKIPSAKVHHINNLKRMKPIRNIMSEITPLKKPIYKPLYGKSMNSDTQNIELNPWSTTEIKLKEQNEPLYQI